MAWASAVFRLGIRELVTHPYNSSEGGHERREDGTTEETTHQARRAVAGDPEAVEWIVSRFSPVLEQQFRHRLPNALKRVVDLEDVLQDVWASALPRLGELELRHKSVTRVLLRYLSAILLNRVNELARRHARARRAKASQATEARGMSRLSERDAGVVTRALRNEVAHSLREYLTAMDPVDQEILILRGVEQRSTREVAELTGRTEDSVSRRYTRALAKLRERLPGTILDGLD